MADQSLDFPDSDDGLLEKTVESKLLHQGKFLTLKIDTVELPDGKHATREFVEHPGAVMILHCSMMAVCCSNGSIDIRSPRSCSNIPPARSTRTRANWRVQNASSSKKPVIRHANGFS